MLEVYYGYKHNEHSKNHNFSDICLTQLENTPINKYVNNFKISNDVNNNLSGFELSSTALVAQDCSTPETAAQTICHSGEYSLVYKNNYLKENDSTINKSIFTDNSIKVSRLSKLYSGYSLENFEKLDIQAPLLEYLVRHHAISEESSNRILQVDSSERTSLLLNAIGFPIADKSVDFISHSSSNTPPIGLALLLNALRQSGQHELASYLDYSRRIPTQYSQCNSNDSKYSTDSSVQRRRGQISIWIQLLAIKVCPTVYHQFNPQSESNYNANQNYGLPSYVQELEQRNNVPNKGLLDLTMTVAITKTKSKTLSPNAIWIDHVDLESHLNVDQTTAKNNQTNEETKDENSNTSLQLKPKSKKGPMHLLLCCFPKLARKHFKSSSSTSLTQALAVPIDNQTHSSSIYYDPLEKNNQVLKHKQVLIDLKSDELNQNLLNPQSTIHDALVKYLEQSLGLLVLDCQLDLGQSSGLKSALRVDIVATQKELILKLIQVSNPHQVQHLPCQTTSKLADDLTNALIQVGVLDQLGLQNFQLCVTLNSQEVQMAIDELIGLDE